ncbi:MAG: hypothetical protein ACI4UF_01905, partial [Thermoguttaceae bacterium]
MNCEKNENSWAKDQTGPASTRDLNTDFHGLKGLKGFLPGRLHPFFFKNPENPLNPWKSVFKWKSDVVCAFGWAPRTRDFWGEAFQIKPPIPPVRKLALAFNWKQFFPPG